MKKNILLTLVILAAAALGFWFFKSKANSHGEAAYAHTEAILAFGPRPAESEGLKKSRAYIASELGKIGWATTEQSVERLTPQGNKTFVNLIARYQGDKLTAEQLKSKPVKGLLCAHLDSKQIPGIPDFLGADDAASACGLILEIAKTITTENPELAGQLELVFFDGEEAFGESITLTDGLYGSRAYAITLYDRVKKPEFGILLDMVGHKNLKIAVPSDSPDQLVRSMKSAAQKLGHSKHFTVAQGSITDDHIYINKAGVPMIDLIGADFAHSNWWHQEGDNIDNISAASLSISHDVTVEMLRELLAK